MKIMHRVAVKFKDLEGSLDLIEAVKEKFFSLKESIKAEEKDIITYLSWHEISNDSMDQKAAKEFTHYFEMHFLSAEDRKYYLLHPAHREFCDLYINPILDDFIVLDTCSD